MKISQREARRLRKRVDELESQEDSRRNRWAAEYVGGTEIARYIFDSELLMIPTAVRTARSLRHAVVVVDHGATLRFLALPVAKGE